LAMMADRHGDKEMSAVFRCYKKVRDDYDA
jgi:hypothetical protein